MYIEIKKNSSETIKSWKTKFCVLVAPNGGRLIEYLVTLDGWFKVKIIFLKSFAGEAISS